MQESGIYKNYQDVLNSLIDPKLIFFSEKLTDQQISQFKKRLLPGALDPKTLKENEYLNFVCEQMQSYDPPFCFLVDDHFSGDQIPGFFTVPFNFKPKELKQKFESLKGQIEEEQRDYIQYYDYYQELQKQLRQNHHISVDLKDFKGNADISEKILMMKRLSRYKIVHSEDSVPEGLKFYAMTKEEYDVAITHYFEDRTEEQIKVLLQKTAVEVLIDQKKKVLHLVNFRDEDILEVIQKINLFYEQRRNRKVPQSQNEKQTQKLI